MGAGRTACRRQEDAPIAGDSARAAGNGRRLIRNRHKLIRLCRRAFGCRRAGRGRHCRTRPGHGAMLSLVEVDLKAISRNPSRVARNRRVLLSPARGAPRTHAHHSTHTIEGVDSRALQPWGAAVPALLCDTPCPLGPRETPLTSPASTRSPRGLGTREIGCPTGTPSPSADPTLSRVTTARSPQARTAGGGVSRGGAGTYHRPCTSHRRRQPRDMHAAVTTPSGAPSSEAESLLRARATSTKSTWCMPRGDVG